MNTIGEALRVAATRLAETSDTARLDAEVLMAHALGVSRSDMLLWRQDDQASAAFEELVARRLAHEPVAQILGRKEFYGLDLEVNRHVLTPRADSETLIETAREAFSGSAPGRILDLGTGSGALLLAALSVWPESEGLGVERDPEALFTAVRNADRAGINAPPDEEEIERMRAMPAEAFIERRPTAVCHIGRARFNLGDWRKKGWRKYLGRFDLILCNPPYVEDSADLAPSVRDYEPAGALFAGPEGLDDYRILIPELPKLLEPGGIAVLEIGTSQAEPVTRIAADAGFSAELRRDLGGRPRALILRRA